MNPAPLAVLAVFAVFGSAFAGPVVRVTIDPAARAEPATGRLIVLMKSSASGLSAKTEPLDGPFWEEEQPLFAVDVKDLKPGGTVEVGDAADAFPASLSNLKPGTYEVQARLDLHRLDSEWRREPGNLYSSARATLTAAGQGVDITVNVTLDKAVAADTRPATPGVEWFSVRSKLLSEFRGREVVLRAGVVLPAKYDQARRYAAVYEVPGFGGNDAGAVGDARRRSRNPDALAGETFWIVLDPEGPNGHTLFADSANNGPCGRALVEELIPALEAKYPLVGEASARLLRGHSSGGWSTLWLATEYPGTFGACWSSAPDPVDFRAFQLVDIYNCRSMYTFDGLEAAFGESLEAKRRVSMTPASLVPIEPVVPDGGEKLVSYRRDGKPIMTVEREARGEDILGPDNTSGQQWDSWFAVFGPRNAAGNPAALFDPVTGTIDRTVAERYRAYDLADRLRKDPAKYAPIFRTNIRLVVGGEDNFFLEQAVTLLKADLDAIPGSSPDDTGSITIVPGKDHGSVFSTKEVRAFEGQMLEHLRKAGHAK
jgi:hypothetical protein